MENLLSTNCWRLSCYFEATDPIIGRWLLLFTTHIYPLPFKIFIQIPKAKSFLCCLKIIIEQRQSPWELHSRCSFHSDNRFLGLSLPVFLCGVFCQLLLWATISLWLIFKTAFGLSPSCLALCYVHFLSWLDPQKLPTPSWSYNWEASIGNDCHEATSDSAIHGNHKLTKGV